MDLLHAPSGSRSKVKGLLLVFALVLLPGCVTGASDDPATIARLEANDPYEAVNRSFFAINTKLDHGIVAPSARRYRNFVPEPVRGSIRNFLNNFASPTIFANDLLQGEWQLAGDTFSRFFVNTTIGIGGLFDVAKHSGVEYHYEDFGQTLAVWGVAEGPYVVLPLYGPAPPRDMAGLLIDRAFNPLSYFAGTDPTVASATLTMLDLIDIRADNLENVDAIERTSLDYYATMRSIYRQNRKAEINNGEEDPDDFDDFDFELEDF
jgi:phospholipid-binding lipoprotein MlaA